MDSKENTEIANDAQNALAKKPDVNVHQMFIDLQTSDSKKLISENDDHWGQQDVHKEEDEQVFYINFS